MDRYWWSFRFWLAARFQTWADWLEGSPGWDNQWEFIRDMASPTDGPDMTDAELAEMLRQWDEEDAPRGWDVSQDH